MSDYGRRIYIHENSFTYLSIKTPAKALEISEALVSTRAWRIIGHYVIDDALPLGRFRQTAADAVRDIFRGRWGTKMTELLRAANCTPAGVSALDEARSVLAPDETIVASCSDSGYLTFATTEASAVRMFADQVPLRTLRRRLAEQTPDPDLIDLTLIHGDALTLADGISPSSSAAHTVSRVDGDDSSEPFEAVHALYRGTAVELLKQMASTLMSEANNLSQEENQVLDQALGAARRVILKLPTPSLGRNITV